MVTGVPRLNSTPYQPVCLTPKSAPPRCPSASMPPPILPPAAPQRSSKAFEMLVGALQGPRRAWLDLAVMRMLASLHCKRPLRDAWPANAAPYWRASPRPRCGASCSRRGRGRSNADGLMCCANSRSARGRCGFRILQQHICRAATSWGGLRFPPEPQAAAVQLIFRYDKRSTSDASAVG